MRQKALALLCALMLAVLPGCSLAKEEDPLQASEDRMVGVLVPRGEKENEWYSHQDANGRIYADILAEGSGHRVVFPIEGASVCCARFPMEDGDDYLGCGTEGAVESSVDIRYGDGTEEIFVEATLYVIAREGDVAFAMNPMYQDGQGRIYAVNGTGIESPAGREGELCSTRQEDTVTVTRDGRTEQESFSVNLTVYGLFQPVKDVFYQMSAGHQVLAAAEYLPGGAPEELALEPDCAYVVHESHRSDLEGRPVVRRALYEPEGGDAVTFFDRGGGICERITTRLNWDARGWS